jgi:hypothetical protein
MYTDVNGEEKWYFNSSIAEQTNVWFGKFHPICREMDAIHYEFFLNVMILLYNQRKKAQLDADGFHPTYFA